MNISHGLEHANEWMLMGIQANCGLELTIEQDIKDGIDLSPPFPTRKIVFNHPISWAIIDLSRIAEYYRDTDCPPVIRKLKPLGNETFVRGFTVNTENVGSNWQFFRVTTASDIVDVISQEEPIVKSI